MFAAYLEDVEAFTRDLGGEATFTRLAVTPEHVCEFNLPTARQSRPTGAPSAVRPAKPKRSPLTCSPQSCATPSRRVSIAARSIVCFAVSAKYDAS